MTAPAPGPAPSGCHEVSPTAGQQQALDELHAMAEDDRGLRVENVAAPAVPGGVVFVRISLACARMPRAPQGAPLFAREPITVSLPAAMPFAVPAAHVEHTRFEQLEHFAWGQLCLYRSPGTEWDPADGMFGFIDRLGDWLRRAAVGQLALDGRPLHPPLAAADPALGLIVVHANAPVPQGRPWLGGVLLRASNPRRLDLLAWVSADDPWPRTADSARTGAGLTANGDSELILAPAVIVDQAFGTAIYPENIDDLLQVLASRDIAPITVLQLLRRAVHHDRALSAEYDITRRPERAPRRRGRTRHDPRPTPEPRDDGAGRRSVADLRVAMPLLLGDPTRGTAGPGGHRVPHLAAWALPTDLPDLLAGLSRETDADGAAPDLVTLNRARRALAQRPTRWVPLDDARTQINVPRDSGAPGAWLRGRKVLVLGLGALGGPIALECARAGVARLEVVDTAAVRHGVLLRQPYRDADLGTPKTDALVARIQRDFPDLPVHGHRRDATTVLEGCLEVGDFDLIVDATANGIVRAALERHRRTHHDRWPPAVTLLIGPTAQRGLALLNGRSAVGGAADLLRHLGTTLATHRPDPHAAAVPGEPATWLPAPTNGSSPTIASPPASQPPDTELAQAERGTAGDTTGHTEDNTDGNTDGEQDSYFRPWSQLAAALHRDFFSTEDHDPFTPEPGCSEATFRGGGADTLALVGPLLSATLAALDEPDGPSQAALAVQRPTGPTGPALLGARWWSVPADVVLPERAHGYEVRVRSSAWTALLTQVRVGAAIRPTDVETGGALLGAIDNAIGVIWVDEVTGPPCDSRLSTLGFRPGQAGLRELLEHREGRDGPAVGFVGMWHTHPGGSAEPSARDDAAMTAMVTDLDHGPRRALMLILGGPNWTAVVAGECTPQVTATLVQRAGPTLGGAPTRGGDTATTQSRGSTRTAGWPTTTWWIPASDHTPTRPDTDPPSERSNRDACGDDVCAAEEAAREGPDAHDSYSTGFDSEERS